jgi:hypothetical protein
MEAPEHGKLKGLEEPYFAKQLPPAAPGFSSTGPNVMFIDFLNQLSGPARVEIDLHQEMLVMALRSRCLKYAFSQEAESAVAVIDQLCAFYNQCAIKVGLKAFEVLATQNDEYIKIQEQFFYSHQESRGDEQRPVQQTNNMLVHIHDLLEGRLRRLATLGLFSMDVIRGRDVADTLTPTQYVDLDLRTKERAFGEDVSILASTHAFLFGAVQHEIRNAIAHKRYEIQEDGSVTLHDFDPRKRVRKQIGQLSQEELRTLISSLERAVDIFEISILIFQHNNGTLLKQLGHYDRDKNYSEKEVREMIYLNAAASFMRIDGIDVRDDAVTIDASFLSFESRSRGSEVLVNSHDRGGNPLRYKLPIAPCELSARDQSFRLLQVASMYCRAYKSITVRTRDIVGSKPLGEVTASVDLLARSLESRLSKEEFLKGLTDNTFPSDEEAPDEHHIPS